MLLLRLFRPPPATVPVKEVMDPRPCRACGRPTWSLLQVCVPCKRDLSAERLAAVALRRLAGDRPEHELADVAQILAFFPPTIRRRFVRRLFMERFMVPPWVVIALVATATFVTLGLCAVMAAMIAFVLVSGAEPASLRSFLWMLMVPSFVSLPVIGSVRMTAHLFTGLRRELAHGAMEWTGDQVRCRTCPNCGHDQTATRETVCPRCACPVCFS